MSMPVVSKATNILIAAADRELSRQLSRFLHAAGYPTCEAAAEATALVAIETGDPRIVIVDVPLAANDDWALCRLLAERPASQRPFLLLLTSTADDAQARAALEAGVDDILLLPVCYGELLARLRVAGRVLEHDRRVSRQEAFDPVTGLWSQSAFVGQLRQHWAVAGEKSEDLACVVIDLDLTRTVRQSQGEASVARLLAAVAHELNQLRGKAGVLACLGGDRFGVMMPEATSEVATQWAEIVRHELADHTFQTGGHVERRLTVSLGVAGSKSATSAEQLLEQAVIALDVAKASGRNCVMRYDEIAGETSPLNLQSKVLERTTARHVMTPCPVYLQGDDSSVYAGELLRQTRLEALPVVDEGGQLLGLCKQELLDNSPRRGPDQCVSSAMIADVHRFRPADDVAALIDFFNNDPLAWAVVVEQGQPLGLLSCDSLVALSQSASSNNPAGNEPFDATTAYLLVPDLALEEVGQDA
ncbi:MAG: diguanylate cyclase [Pirellulales bacterium]